MASGKENGNAPRSKRTLIAVAGGAVLLAVAAFIGWGVWLALHPAPEPLQGQIDATTVDVAAKIPGRVEVLSVKEGDQVKQGDEIAKLYVPEIEAKVRQARAAVRARSEKANLAEEGARPQEIKAARAVYERAKAAETLAHKTYERISKLYSEGFVPAQKLDEARANLDASAGQARAAKEQWDIAVTGTRRQDKAAANAVAAQAQSALEEALSYQSEASVKSPISGEVSRLLLRAGEVAPQGFPLITVVDLNDIWAAFNLREDQFPGIRVGTILKVKVPMVDGAAHDFRVYFISPKADYATWRATRENKGFDLKTFEIRARPVDPIPGLRPGMTALIDRAS